jgi:hypothetical protein
MLSHGTILLKSAVDRDVTLEPQIPDGLVAFAATAAVPAAPTAAAAAALFAGPGFVDRQRAAIDFFLVQAGDRCLSLAIIRHFDKTEALAATGVPVHDNLGALNAAKFGEQRFQALVVSIVTEVSNVQASSHKTIPYDLPVARARTADHSMGSNMVIRQAGKARQGGGSKAKGSLRLRRQTD